MQSKQPGLFVDSEKPLRSKRFDSYASVALVNNLATFSPRRGVYRLQAVCVSSGDGFSPAAVFFRVSSVSTAVEVFGVGAAWGNVIAELLPVCMVSFGVTAKVHSFSPGYAVEVDVQDGERIHFWGQAGSEVVKISRVGDLPPRDSEINDNHSANWE